MPVINSICGECYQQPAAVGFTRKHPMFCWSCAQTVAQRFKLDFDIDEEVKGKIVNAAGKALGLSVNILTAVKVDFRNEKDRDVPLGTVLVIPLLYLWHLPTWWWRKNRVIQAVADVVPKDRKFMVHAASATVEQAIRGAQ